MLFKIANLLPGTRDDDLERLMRTEFSRDYSQIKRMNNGHVDARAFLENTMGSRRG